MIFVLHMFDLKWCSFVDFVALAALAACVGLKIFNEFDRVGLVRRMGSVDRIGFIGCIGGRSGAFVKEAIQAGRKASQPNLDNCV